MGRGRGLRGIKEMLKKDQRKEKGNVNSWGKRAG